MPTLVIPNAFQVTIQSVAGGQDVVNVVGVTNAGGTALGAATAVKAAWEQAGGPVANLSANQVMTNYRGVDLSSLFGDIADVPSTTPGGVSGTLPFATLAATALVQWNGATRSRSTRGRLYLGPLREDQINPDGRTLVPASRTSLISCMNAFRTSLASAGYPLAVLSRKNMAAYPVSSSAVQSVIATQRRRLR